MGTLTVLDSTGATVSYSSPDSAIVSLTRTANTVAYTAGAVVGSAIGSTAALTFANMGASGKETVITSVSLEVDAAALISGETSYTLHLYNVTPPSVLGDNTAFDLAAGDRTAYLGSIDLGIPVKMGSSTLYVQRDGVGKQIKLSSTSVFAYLVTVGTYTPTASRVFVLALHTAPA